MACFVVPLVQAVATSVYRKRNSKAVSSPDASPFMRHLPSLEKMLWGGMLMLIVDHIINGELTWRLPFFTALDQVGGGSVMLKEMLTVGVPMSVVLTAAWAVWAIIKSKKESIHIQTNN